MIDLPTSALIAIFGGYFCVLALVPLLLPETQWEKKLLSHADKFSSIEQVASRTSFLLKLIAATIVPTLIILSIYFLYKQFALLPSSYIFIKTAALLIFLTIVLVLFPIFVYFLLLNICVVVQRLHDMGFSGWWYIGVIIVSSLIEFSLNWFSGGIVVRNYFLIPGAVSSLIIPIFYLSLLIYPSKIRANKYRDKGIISSTQL